MFLPPMPMRDRICKHISVYWEILPPGERTETLARILSKFRAPSEAVKKKLLERYAFLEKLKPVAYISGTSGFQRYFGAKFGDNLVVFENIEYGNAVYIMFEKWEELSKLSRIELLRSRRSAGFQRVVHPAGWQDIVASVVNDNRPKSFHQEIGEKKWQKTKIVMS